MSVRRVLGAAPKCDECEAEWVNRVEVSTERGVRWICLRCLSAMIAEAGRQKRRAKG